jgi:hypothetical protein
VDQQPIPACRVELKVRIRDSGFFEALRSKLSWGER